MMEHLNGMSVGSRIKAARRARGFRTTRELADAMPGSNIKSWTLDNIETGRKANLDVSTLLNIARALRLPPIYLLVPMGKPDDLVDLDNLSDAFDGMTVGEFDSWLSATSGAAYRSGDSDERIAIGEVEAYRTLQKRLRGLAQLAVVEQVVEEDPELAAGANLNWQIEGVEREIDELTTYLRSAGWAITRMSDDTSTANLAQDI